MMSLHVRRTVGAVAVLALVVVQVALADAADPRKQPLDRLTAADNAAAKSSLVRRSDLIPRLDVRTNRTRTPHVPTCASYPGDRSDITITGFASTAFQYRSKAGRPMPDSIGASAFLFKTSGDSDRYWQKTVRLQYIKCLATSLEFGPVREPIRFQHIILATQIAIGESGADKAVAYRLIAYVRPPGQQRFYWTETVAFVKVGRGIVAIRIAEIDRICECHTIIARDLVPRLTYATR